MNTAEQILDKHLKLRNWTKTVPKNGNLYNTLIDALNEALSIGSVTHSMTDDGMSSLEFFDMIKKNGL